MRLASYVVAMWQEKVPAKSQSQVQQPTELQYCLPDLQVESAL